VPSTPIVKNEIRPFVIAARPVVRELKPAAVNLAKAPPNLNKVFTVLNHLFNMLGYYPTGNQHGYLWWLAWLDHNARTVFSVQDANGDYRPLFLQASCATLTQLVNQTPLAEAILNLTPILSNAGLCPKQAAANQHAYQAYEKQYGNGSGTASNAASGASNKLPNGSAKTLPNTAAGATGSNNSSNAPLFIPKLPTG
jgi:hypothetical protein